MKFYLPTLKHLVIQLAKLQIYTLNLTTTFWHCKNKSHYFWTGVYINICSTRVQILGDLSVWTPKLCFCEVRKHVNKLKSLNSPTSFSTIKVNFDKIQFKDYCIYRPNSFLWLKYILFYSKRFPGLSILHLDNYLCYEENENTRKKRYLIQNIKYFQK